MLPLGPRLRTRVVQNTSGFIYGKGTVPSTPGWDKFLPEMGSGFTDYYNEYSSMADSVNRKPYPYSNVTHVRRSAAGCGGSTSWSFSPPTPALTVNVANVAMLDTPGASPTINWGGLTDSLADKLSGKIQDSWMGAVFFKEIAQTYKMIKNPFSVLTTDWKKAARQYSARTLSKSSANVWLEYLYGWKSFYQDISSLSKASHSFIKDIISDKYSKDNFESRTSKQDVYGVHPDVYVGSASTSNAWNSILALPRTDRLNYPTLRFYDLKWKYTGRVSCQQLRTIEDEARLTRRIFQGVNLTNWRSLRDTIWEVIPFSFVIDWFVDTRGLWNLLNNARLHSADVFRLGYSTKYDCTYKVEGLPSFTKIIYSGVQPWSYKWPTLAEGDSILSCKYAGSHRIYTRNSGSAPVANFYSSCLEKGLSATQLLSGITLLAQKNL